MKHTWRKNDIPSWPVDKNTFSLIRINIMNSSQRGSFMYLCFGVAKEKIVIIIRD